MTTDDPRLRTLAPVMTTGGRPAAPPPLGALIGSGPS
jgi:hypothetical protein